MFLVVSSLLVAPPAPAQSCNGEACLQDCTATGCVPVYCASYPEGDCYCNVTSRLIGPGQVVNICRSYFPCSLQCPGDGTGFPIVIMDPGDPSNDSLLGALVGRPFLRTAIEAAYNRNLSGFHPQTRALISYSLPGVDVPAAAVRRNLEAVAPFMVDTPDFEFLLEGKARGIGSARSVAFLAVVTVDRNADGALFIEARIYEHSGADSRVAYTISANDSAWKSAEMSHELVGTIDAGGDRGSFAVYDRASGSAHVAW